MDTADTEEPPKPLTIVGAMPLPPDEAKKWQAAHRELIYHYTSAPALLNIVTKRTLWLTSTDFVNDVYEFQQPTRRLRNMLQHPDTGSVPPKHLQAFPLHLNNNMLTFVTSFSQASNSLSQFRLYGQGAGYSIGLPRSYLERVAAQFSSGPQPRQGSAGIVNCNYSSDELNAWCRAYAADFFQAAKTFDNAQMSSQEIWDAIYANTDLFDRRLMAQMVFKSDQFAVEQEVRFYKFGFSGMERCWRTSRGGNYVVPYLEIELPNEPVLALLSAGPNLDNALAQRSCNEAARAGEKAGTAWSFTISGPADSGFRVGL